MMPSRAAQVGLALITVLLLIAIYGPIGVTVAGAFLPVKGGIIQSFSPSLAAFHKLAADAGLIRWATRSSSTTRCARGSGWR